MTSVRPRFVVTGCARSGTLFMAKALSRLGHPCGHEVLFTPATTTVPDFGTADGDVSWLAAPFVDQLPAGSVVLHQVREPMATIRSLVGMRVFQTRPHVGMDLRYRLQHLHIRAARPILNPRFVRFAAEHCPGAFAPDDEPSRAATYWTRWNRLIEAQATGRDDVVYRRYRVEDLDDELLVELDHLLGGTATVTDAADVRGALGTSTHRTRQVDAVALEDLATPAAGTALRAAAADFGYDLSAR